MRPVILVIALSSAAALAQTFPPPIDPQKVQDQDTMTWADYHPIPRGRLGRSETHTDTQVV